MHNSVNITVGEKEERMMMTGMHTVVDIFCVGCGSIVGWKYEAAQEKAQKYKEGKFILESDIEFQFATWELSIICNLHGMIRTP
ncbi:protein yippee-like [Citrus sinensis]|uniref:Protein yippee-like n=1 Tax=Citrus sinensis TaxID=2711 RepID=A0ACB8JVC3_CITSI|nr:protein yippee-like [Citrus sinensis]